MSARETRTCWVCQQDDTEDTAENSEWRTPCPCSLTAHDACLQEWISNEEAPKLGEIAHNHTIKCPQCQAEIKIERPKDYLVAVAEKIQRLAQRAVIPMALSAVITGTWAFLQSYGLTVMFMVFGRQELYRIWGIYPRSGYPLEISSMMFKSLVCLPLIGPALVLARTRLADQAFALALPLYFLQPSHRDLTWPPSPGFAFAALPTIKLVYSELYTNVFGGLEKKWDQAVQRRPRPGETQEQIAAEANIEGGGDNLVIELDVGWNEVDNNDDDDDEMPNLEEIHDIVDIVEPVDAAEPEPNDLPPLIPDPPPQPADNANANANANPNRDRWGVFDPHNHDGRATVNLGALLSTTIGALCFPVISSACGQILYYTLPTRLVYSHTFFNGRIWVFPSRGRGLLKEQWGRTLVGGAIFVVIKDAVTLYCKWKKARDFGNRKVLDWKGKRDAEA